MVGSFTYINVNKCTLSFSASSTKVCIQLLSLSIYLKDLKCLCIPPAKPGTPATVSKKMILLTHLFSEMTPSYQGKTFLYPEQTSNINLKLYITPYAILSPKL